MGINNLSNKKKIYQLMNQLANSSLDSLEENLRTIYHDDAHWRGSHPMNEVHGVAEIKEKIWQPLLTSFPDLERRDTIILGGEYEGREYVGAVGHYCGTFRADWLGIPMTGRTVYLRYGEFHQVKDGKVVQSTVLIDVLDVMRQAGFWPLSPSLGTEGMWPGPITADGILLTEQDEAQGKQSLALTLEMHQVLNSYNDVEDNSREGLLGMYEKDCWHPKMMWYGPAGIGTTRGLLGFVDYHQRPFRIAFPNRKAGNLKKGYGHYVRIGDGAYSATSGWPSVGGVHNGGNFMGVPPTGKEIKMRVMDFYLAHEGLIRENWVPIDVLDILSQMGVDVFERMEILLSPEKYV